MKDRKILIRKKKTAKNKHCNSDLSCWSFLQGASKIIGEIEPFSYEALREWYTKCSILFQPGTTIRQVIAVDETKIKKEGQQIYIWNTVDISNTIIAIHLSTTRTSLDAIHFFSIGPGSL